MSDPNGEVIPAGVALPQIAAMIRRLESAALTADDRATQLRIMENILSAEDEESLFRAQEAGTVSSKNFLEIPFRLRAAGIEWRQSAPQYVEQGQFPVYALLTVETLEHGDTVVVNAGGLSTCAVLAKMTEWDEDTSRPVEKRPFAAYEEDGGRPMQFVARTTTSGYDVILLKPVVVAPAKTTRSRTAKNGA